MFRMLLTSKIKSLGLLTIKLERKSLFDQLLSILVSNNREKKRIQFLKV
jgi:hypothetical protein